jgi:hypothetical protein
MEIMLWMNETRNEEWNKNSDILSRLAIFFTKLILKNLR